MPIPLRIMLLIIAFSFIMIVFYAVNKKLLQMHYSLVWIVVSLGMILMAAYPEVLTWLMPILGIEVASNFIFLLGLVVLLAISFSLTVIVSKQAVKIRHLTQTFAIAQFLREEKDENVSSK